MGDESAARFRSGLIFGLIAYIWWGLVPLYFAALKDHGVPAWEILAHRITWSLPIMLVLTAVHGRMGPTCSASSATAGSS